MRVLLLSLLTACAVDDLAETSEDLTVSHIVQTCFLDGVQGRLSDGPGPIKHPITRHTVSVDNFGSVTGSGEAACMNVVQSGLHYLAWGTNEKGDVATQTSYTGDADTWCFLYDIQGSGLDAGQIALTHTGNTWSLASSSNGNTPIPGYAEAVCFEYAATSQWSFTFTATTPLQNYYPGGPAVPTSAATCGLTAIGGDWTSANNAWLDTTGANLVFAMQGPASASLNCIR